MSALWRLLACSTWCLLLTSCGGGGGAPPRPGDPDPEPGATSFAKTYGSDGAELPVPAFKTADGGFLLVNEGTVSTASLSGKIDVTKLDAAGDVVWSTIVSTTRTQDYFIMSDEGMARDSQGKVWLAGDTRNGELRVVRVNEEDGTEELRRAIRLSNQGAFGLTADEYVARDPEYVVVDHVIPARFGGVHIGGRLGIDVAFTRADGSIVTYRRRAWFIVSLTSDGTTSREWYLRRDDGQFADRMHLAESKTADDVLYAAVLNQSYDRDANTVDSEFTLFEIGGSETQASQLITTQQPYNLRIEALTALSAAAGGRILATLSTSNGNHWRSSFFGHQFHASENRSRPCRGSWTDDPVPGSFERCLELPSYRDETFVHVFEPPTLRVENTASFSARGGVHFYEACVAPQPCKLVVLEAHAYDEMNPQGPLARPSDDPNAVRVCAVDLTTPDITLSSMRPDLSSPVDSALHCRFYTDRSDTDVNRAWDWRAAPYDGSPAGLTDFLLFSDPVLLDPRQLVYDADTGSWVQYNPAPGVPAAFIVTLIDSIARIDRATEFTNAVVALRYGGGFARAADGDPIVVKSGALVTDQVYRRDYGGGPLVRYDGIVGPTATTELFEYLGTPAADVTSLQNVELLDVFGAVQTTDGGYVVAFAAEVPGYSQSEEPLPSLVAVKLDSDGNLDWKRAYAGLENLISSLTSTADGGFSGYVGRLFVRFDATGDIVEQRPYGIDDRVDYGIDDEVVAAVVQLDDGRDASVSASMHESGADDGSLLTLYNPLSPDATIRREFPTLYSSIADAGDGGVVIGGYSAERAAFQLTKVSGTGEEVWSHTYGASLFTPSAQPSGRWIGPETRVRSTADGGFVFAFTVVSAQAGEDVVLIRTDEQGRALWWRRYGSATDESLTGLEVTNDTGMLVTAKTLMNHTLPLGPGFSGDEDRYQDNWLLRLGADGDLSTSCNARLDGGNERIDAPVLAEIRNTSIAMLQEPAPTDLPAITDPALAIAQNTLDTLIVARQCSAAFTTNPGFTPIVDTPVTLIVTQSGTGSGVVRSNPPGIRCGASDDPLSDCSETWNEGTQVELDVDAADIGNFQRWLGCDSVSDNLATGDRCHVTIDQDSTLSVNFSAPVPASSYLLEFTTVGPEGYVIAGVVGADEGSDGITCRTDDPTDLNDCTAIVPAGATVRFTRQALEDFNEFLRWGGDCADLNGLGPFPEIVMDRDRTCTAEFSMDTHIRLNYTVEGPPGTTDQPATIGDLVSDPPGRECRFHPGVCYGWPAGTGPVQITATPFTSRRPWLFYRWGGECGREALNAAGGDLRVTYAQTITLSLQQSYPDCSLRFATNVTRAVIDVPFANLASVTMLDSNGQPSTSGLRTCREDCEIARLGDASTNGSIMDLIVENLELRVQFNGWTGCDSEYIDAAISPYPICRIGANSYGVFNVTANVGRP